MDKEECMEKVRSMLAQFSWIVEAEASNLFSSGGVDTAKHEAESYALPKMLLTAAIHRQKDAYAPPDSRKDLKADLKNLINM